MQIATGDFGPDHKIRLTAGDGIETHPLTEKPFPLRPIEFDVPPEAIVDRELLLTWTGEPDKGGCGAQCQMAEVWLSIM